jgi:hypothetical protein
LYIFHQHQHQAQDQTQNQAQAIKPLPPYYRVKGPVGAEAAAAGWWDCSKYPGTRADIGIRQYVACDNPNDPKCIDTQDYLRFATRKNV